MNESQLVELRKRCLHYVASALVAAEVADEIRQDIIAHMSQVFDDLVARLAKHSANLNRRETVIAAQSMFAGAWPVLCRESIPGLLLARGLDRIRLTFPE